MDQVPRDKEEDVPQHAALRIACVLMNQAAARNTAMPAKVAGSSEPARIPRSCTTDHPFGVQRPMLARVRGIQSNGTNPPPSITSGSVTKLVSIAASRSD